MLQLNEAAYEQSPGNSGNENITKKGNMAFVQAIQSPHCPRHLSFTMGGDSEELDDEVGVAIAKAMENGKCPPHLSIDLECCRIAEKGAIALAQALESKNCPRDLKLVLNNNYLSRENNNYLSEKVGFAFAKALLVEIVHRVYRLIYRLMKWVIQRLMLSLIHCKVVIVLLI